MNQYQFSDHEISVLRYVISLCGNFSLEHAVDEAYINSELAMALLENL